MTLNTETLMKFREYSLRLALENKLGNETKPEDVVKNAQAYVDFLADTKKD